LIYKYNIKLSNLLLCYRNTLSKKKAQKMSLNWAI